MVIALDPWFSRLAVATIVTLGASDAQAQSAVWGINYWLTERTGLRFDVRATRLTRNFQSPV